MKRLEEQTHYEVLELPQGARPEDVERAYPVVRAIYDGSSLALYSVYDDADSASIRDRIDLAYQVLSDVEQRTRYDDSIGVDPATESAAPRVPREAIAGNLTQQSGRREVGTLEAIDEVEDETGSDYGGARLRRARLRRGFEIDDLANVTKINPRYLKAIEDELFAELPPAVYARGFVSAYARAVGCAEEEAASSFMQRYRAARPPEHETGRRGRRLP